MRPTKALCGTILLLGALAAGSAAAHGVRFGFGFGFPVFPGPYYSPYYSPYYYPPSYYPPVVTVPAQPPVYVERGEGQAPPAAAPESFWYYCPDSQTYYPYVQTCPSTWQRVSPRPPGT